MVSVENIEGRLRLRFSYGGRQRAFHLGLSEEHRKQAELIAKQLEFDIARGEFDGNYDRYKKLSKPKDTVLESFRSYTLEKDKYLAPNSLQRYRSLLNHLEQDSLGRVLSDAVLLSDVSKFLAGLKCSDATARRYIEMLRAAGVSIPAIKLQSGSRQTPKPFSREEIGLILSVPNHYNSFIRFLFCSGCRIGEARALRYKHITETEIWIDSAFDRWDNPRTTKTGKTRTLPLTESLRTILFPDVSCRAGEKLVFTAPSGGIIDHWVFAKDWKKILLQAAVEYRKPYTLRSTFISHCLHSGLSPIEVAALVGNSPRTIYEHYAGLVSSPKIPEFF